MKENGISSRSNPKIKALQKLINDKNARYESGLYVLEGKRVVEDTGSVEDLFICDGTKIPDIKYKDVFFIRKEIFSFLSSTENSQGIVATAVIKLKNSTDVKSDSNYVLLDKLQDPGNMGAIIRTSAAFGLKGIIFGEGTVDPFSPKTVRAAAGNISKLDMIKLAKYSELSGFNIIAADTEGKGLNEFDWPDNFILAIGNEGSGISEELLNIVSKKVAIPMPGNIESLNASVSAGIILYNALFSGKV